MLSIDSISASYHSQPFLREISFQVKPGQVVALIGPNGAGKTTLIRAISCILPLLSGGVTAFGKDLHRISPPERARLLGVVPQARQLPPSYTVYQTVLIGRTPYLGWLGQPGTQDLQRTRWALERTALEHLGERRINELSGGEQQLVLLARTLAQDTPILLLDEPTAHLDLHHQSTLLKLVRELAREKDLAILMAIHDLNLVAQHSDKVILMVDGKVESQGTPSEVLTASLLSHAYQVPLQVISHPVYGTPLVLLDGNHHNPAALPREIDQNTFYPRSLSR
jgi:iron complex transport system ATP-binding protein